VAAAAQGGKCDGAAAAQGGKCGGVAAKAAKGGDPKIDEKGERAGDGTASFAAGDLVEVRSKKSMPVKHASSGGDRSDIVFGVVLEASAVGSQTCAVAMFPGKCFRLVKVADLVLRERVSNKPKTTLIMHNNVIVPLVDVPGDAHALGKRESKAENHESGRDEDEEEEEEEEEEDDNRETKWLVVWPSPPCRICHEGISVRLCDGPDKHTSCLGCARGWVVSKLSQQGAFLSHAGLRCMRCHRGMDLNLVRYAVRNETHSIIVRVEERVARLLMLSDYQRCPKPGCCGSGIALPSQTDAKCPVCARCWRLPVPESDTGVKSSEHWKSEHSKPCPGCFARIERNKGCPHMTCAHCRTEFCWFCTGPFDAQHNHSLCDPDGRAQRQAAVYLADRTPYEATLIPVIGPAMARHHFAGAMGLALAGCAGIGSLTLLNKLNPRTARHTIGYSCGAGAILCISSALVIMWRNWPTRR
jgi:hypothetical protein